MTVLKTAPKPESMFLQFIKVRMFMTKDSHLTKSTVAKHFSWTASPYDRWGGLWPQPSHNGLHNCQQISVKGFKMTQTVILWSMISDYSCEHLIQLCLNVNLSFLLCYYFSCILCFTVMKVMIQNNRERNCRSNSVGGRKIVKYRLWK